MKRAAGILSFAFFNAVIFAYALFGSVALGAEDPFQVGARFRFRGYDYDITRTYPQSDNTIIIEAKRPAPSIVKLKFRIFLDPSRAEKATIPTQLVSQLLKTRRGHSHLVELSPIDNLYLGDSSYSAHEMLVLGQSLEENASRLEYSPKYDITIKTTRLLDANNLLKNLLSAVDELNHFHLNHHNINPRNVFWSVSATHWKLSHFDWAAPLTLERGLSIPDLEFTALEHEPSLRYSLDDRDPAITQEATSKSDLTLQERVGTVSDHFSIASTLYWSLFGETPFETFQSELKHSNRGDFTIRQIREHLFQEMVFNTEYGGSLHQIWDSIILKKLALLDSPPPIAEMATKEVRSFLEKGLRLKPEERERDLNQHFAQYPRRSVRMIEIPNKTITTFEQWERFYLELADRKLSLDARFRELGQTAYITNLTESDLSHFLEEYRKIAEISPAFAQGLLKQRIENDSLLKGKLGTLLQTENPKTYLKVLSVFEAIRKQKPIGEWIPDIALDNLPKSAMDALAELVKTLPEATKSHLLRELTEKESETYPYRQRKDASHSLFKTHNMMQMLLLFPVGTQLASQWYFGEPNLWSYTFTGAISAAAWAKFYKLSRHRIEAAILEERPEVIHLERLRLGLEPAGPIKKCFQIFGLVR